MLADGLVFAGAIPRVPRNSARLSAYLALVVWSTRVSVLFSVIALKIGILCWMLSWCENARAGGRHDALNISPCAKVAGGDSTVASGVFRLGPQCNSFRHELKRNLHLYDKQKRNG